MNMERKWKNHIKVIGYLCVIILLLFGAFPLSRVFAEADNTLKESEEMRLEIKQAEVEATSEIMGTQDPTIEMPLDGYLFSGDEYVTICRNDKNVIKQGTALMVEYSIVLEQYHECEQNEKENHVLEVTYTIYQDHTLLQEGALELENGIDSYFCMEYPQIGDYTIEIKASGYEKTDGKIVWNENKVLNAFTERIERSEVQLQADIEKEGHFSYREDYGKSVSLSFFMEEFQPETDGELLFIISSSNEAVIKPENEQEVYSLKDKTVAFIIAGVGEAELVIQPLEHHFYEMEQLVIPVRVENSAMQDEDYRICYTDKNGKESIFSGDYNEWTEFLKQKNGWLNGSVRILLSETGEQFYTGFEWSINGEEKQTEKKELVLEEETQLQSYNFWCVHTRNHATTQNEKCGTREFQTGIDKIPPENIELCCHTKPYEGTSTETIKYYGENVVINGTFTEELSGIASIEYTTQADLGEKAHWKSVSDIVQNSTNTTWELVLEQGIYTGVAIRATDMAGNRSAPVEIKNQDGEYLKMIVDKAEPVLDIVLKTADEKQYNGEWTNQPITILVKESPEYPVLAGIHTIQYQYVSVGAEYEENAWIELSPAGILEIGNNEIQKINKNGTFYFRAITNTGIITNSMTQKNQAKRIRLQQILSEKQPVTEILPELEEHQVWYNRNTGVPRISFAYPEYDDGMESLEYGAPITVHARLIRMQQEGKEEEVVYKTATIGIHSDEEYRQFSKVKNGKTEKSIKEKIASLSIDFSYEKQSGYAQDGIYELNYWISDAAGNESKHERFVYHIDTHEPTQLEVWIDGTEMEADTSQTIQYDRFYAASVSGSVSADYGISGKGLVKLMLAEEMGAWENNTSWLTSESFVLQPCTSGSLYMIAEDAAGNRSVLRTRGIVVDNQAPMGQHGGNMMRFVTKPNHNQFYKDNINIEFSVSDLPQGRGFSGIESFSYTIGTQGKENTQGKELYSFTKTLPSKEELAFAKSYTATDVIDATIYEGNDTYVEIVARDRCGNTISNREELKIDITPPKVEIIFDENIARNGCYYNTARTATIHVQELNFDQEGIELRLTRDGMPYALPISQWQSDGIDHFAYITFYEEGDYTMAMSCMDLADNVSEEVNVEPFTIDLTKPVIDIHYDNNAAQNQVYYQTARTAYLTVKEHNFEEEDFVVIAEPQAVIGSWTHNGDEHSIQITFAEDNHYYFSCNYMDMAGNVGEPMEEQEFYIDLIAPQIVVQGVENDSANAGEVKPVIIVYDTNGNPEGTSITVTTGQREDVPVAIQREAKEQGYAYLLTDMSEMEDNIYFLKVAAMDMAGNKSELVYRFSLNRKGSVYDLSKITEIVEKAYHRSEQISDIIITEMNVDRIEEYSIYVTRNGALLPCEEAPRDVLSATKEERFYYSLEVSGDEEKGYRNSYAFYKENFTKEGLYRITCYSKDRAGNEVNNTLEEKQAEISFVIDNTEPKVVIDGVEEGGVYNEEVKTVHVMVQDNFMLKEARFTLVTQDGEELQSWDYIELVEEAGDVMTIHIPCREIKQFLYYQISDAAGNEIVLLPNSEEVAKGFLVTTNPWLRFITSPIKIAIAFGVFLVICGAGIYCITQKRF